MQAVILAAGTGSRLGEHTKDKPKCLIDVGGKPLIKHQLESLAAHGVGHVMVVLGYRADDVREVVGEGVDCVINTNYKETNSLYSLSLVKDWIEGPFILMNCDILFHSDLIDRLMSALGNALAYDSTSAGGREQTKVAIREGLVLDVGKDMPSAASKGESVGILKFDKNGAETLFETVDELLEQGHNNSWVVEAVRTTCSLAPFTAVNVAGLPWVEIDFPYDLDLARREIWPAIERGDTLAARLWKRARPAALVLGTVVAALGAWLTSSSVGPASIDWESVRPVSGESVSILRERGPQRWWMVQRGDSVVADVGAAHRVRVEFRSLLNAGTRTPGRYVVEISVDGRPYDWQVFKATPDSTATLPNYVVGDRDRVNLVLAPGNHTLGVRLLAGTSSRLITRVRRPE